MRKIISIPLLILFFVISYVMPDLLPTLVIEKPEPLQQINWVHYHNYEEIVTTLCALNKTYPYVVDIFSIGKSVENRDIYCVRLTNESDPTPKPEVLFVGYHHACEQITSELTLYFVVYASTSFGSDQTVTELLNKSEIYVVVALNVDGFDLFEKNGFQRYNARGVDLNRNYDYAWKGGGLAPFSEPETQTIRNLVLKHRFTYAISFHSGIELIFYPWGSTTDPSPDEAKFIEISKALSEVTGGTPYNQSCFLYTAYGTWDDWMYGVAGVFALTVEIFGTNRTIARPMAPYDARARGRTDPLTLPQTGSMVQIRYLYNPYPENIEIILLRWLPVFFYITNRTINEAFHDVLG